MWARWEEAAFLPLDRHSPRDPPTRPTSRHRPLLRVPLQQRVVPLRRLPLPPLRERVKAVVVVVAGAAAPVVQPEALRAVAARAEGDMEVEVEVEVVGAPTGQAQPWIPWEQDVATPLSIVVAPEALVALLALAPRVEVALAPPTRREIGSFCRRERAPRPDSMTERSDRQATRRKKPAYECQWSISFVDIFACSRHFWLAGCQPSAHTYLAWCDVGGRLLA